MKSCLYVSLVDCRWRSERATFMALLRRLVEDLDQRLSRTDEEGGVEPSGTRGTSAFAQGEGDVYS